MKKMLNVKEMNFKQYFKNRKSIDPVNFEELPPIPDSQPVENIPGFDIDAGRTWIYPTNYSVRQYQFDIVKSCLFDNTLVSLPTGLGKTFIAAVVMYNFFRWYPQGKIVFMAPTKVRNLAKKYLSELFEKNMHLQAV